MLSFEKIFDKIKIAIEELDFSRQPVELYAPIEYTLSLGGKRIRPVLCLMACDMFGGQIEDAVPAALGLEIFHNFTLLHDDIMDEAPIRRGKTSVYKKWNTNVAILSGDTMMAVAYDKIMETPGNMHSSVFKIFNQTAIEVCEGQQYDMNFETDDNVSIDDYLKMIRLKTAVLLAGSLKIGAIIGGADNESAENLYQFGENIGIAFQLKDDLLDVFSDEQKFGKKTGGDITTNKKTYLYLKAFELAKGKTLKNLNTLFTEYQKSDIDKVNGVIEIYKQLNIKQLAEELIEKYYRQAMTSLDKVKVDNSQKTELKKFADKLKGRES
ncbi:MAG: polyprenyl synthetase family protein [Bacteroidetes bacterium]|nr:MAG: polyprenyl synthetase family protein [Bacteroidota bacterium]